MLSQQMSLSFLALMKYSISKFITVTYKFKKVYVIFANILKKLGGTFIFQAS